MKHFLFEFSQKIILLLRLFYSLLGGGEECVVCGKKTYVLPVCKTCNHTYFDVRKSVEAARCSKCGRELISTKKICSECRENTTLVHTDSVFPLFDYLLWNKEILFQWKVNGIRSFSAFFAQKVAEALWIMGIYYIVPVPPRPGKIKKNGWDQIDELCTFLRLRYGFTVLNLLERTSTQQQKKLNREKRLSTISSAYIFANEKQLKKTLKPLNGKLPEQVCIIDDVCTTGATIEKCAQILKERGVKRVDAITLFNV